jgi:hypothetical protein
MVTYINVGPDRIMLTAYNPRSVLTMAKCVFALLKITEEMGEIPEEEFRAWLRDEAPEVAARLEAGWEPEMGDELTVDPRNAAQEARIVAFLEAEVRQQAGKRFVRPRLKLKLEERSCQR